MATDHDLIVIGGGAGGLGATRAALWEGADVALISDSPLGGDCTFTGCVPSKALIEVSRRGATFTEAIDHVQAVVSQIAATEDADVLRGEGATVIDGRARFLDRQSVTVGGQTLTAGRFIVATGSKAMVPPIDGLDDVAWMTHERFFDPRARPDRLVIVGGGPIGCELGEAMARFGVQVTILEAGPRLLSRFERDASSLVEDALVARGVAVHTSALVNSVRKEGADTVIVAGAIEVRADELLIATGRTPNTEGLGLEAAGVEVDGRGWVKTDDWLRTTTRGIAAVGDVNGKQMLSHGADEMGRVAAWTLLRRGRRYRYDPNRIPQAVFTTPEVASIGVTEADAPASARVAEIEMQANDRALAAGRPEGFVRLIAAPRALTRNLGGGRLIGATIVGERAGELINEAALVMRSGAFAGRLAQTVRAYPSWSTAVQKAAARWFFDVEGTGARPPRRKSDRMI